MQFPTRWLFWAFAVVNVAHSAILGYQVAEFTIHADYGLAALGLLFGATSAVSAMACAALALDK